MRPPYDANRYSTTVKSSRKRPLLFALAVEQLCNVGLHRLQNGFHRVDNPRALRLGTYDVEFVNVLRLLPVDAVELGIRKCREPQHHDCVSGRTAREYVGPST